MSKIGNYEIVGELGRGAMGVVFRGFDPAIGRPVAIKVIRPQAFVTNEENQEARLRFAREASAAGRLSHPNIVTVFHLGEERDYQFLVMELVEGKALERAAPAQCLPILRQLAGALDYAHAQGVVHRDVKPANILVRADGQVKLTDFGVARISAQTMTQSGVTMGTPSYMAPEQVMSSRVDGRADQFSLGAIAFELLTGRKPFQGDTSQAVMFAIVQGERPAAHEVNRALPPAISVVLRQAMAKEPGARFATCLDFVTVLEAAMGAPAARADASRQAPEPTVTLSPTPPAGAGRRFSLAATAAGAGLALVLLAGVYALIHSGASPAPAARGGIAPGATRTNARDGLTYVWIQPGTFQMGCSPGDSECHKDEQPAHQVSITKGFWLGTTPVTQQAYQRVVGTNPSLFKGADLPVETVNWDEAQAYCRAVGNRLPTEAEWEYAARAGTTGARYGDLNGIAWHSGNSGEKTHEVGQKQANGFGLFDMLGNVWQWVADWYGDYSAGAQSDPSGPAGGQYHVGRGGSWYGNPAGVRVSSRGRYEPGVRFNLIGFRCAGE
jgi:formylglycine-generating enzyme required for sulfatase activity/tRNA A-37 threonylcarbamoyl transferase component Bud32